MGNAFECKQYFSLQFKKNNKENDVSKFNYKSSSAKLKT